MDRATRAPVVVLGVVAVGHLALLLFAFAEPDAVRRFDRVGSRLAGARAVAEAGSVAELAAVAAARGAPGDYAWHGLVRRTVSEAPLATIAVQLCLHAAAVALLWRIAFWASASRRVAWWAAALYAAIPIDFMVPHFIASEAFFNPLLVLGCALLVRHGLRGGTSELLGAGVAFGLAALTRTELVAWLPLAAVAAGLSQAPRSGSRRGHALALALFLVLACGPPLAWAIAFPAPEGELRSPSVAFELVQRAERVEALAGVKRAGERPGADAPLARFLGAAAAHPVAFAREWVVQAGKLLLLPDNLDLFRYLGAYEFTGRRSDLVNERGFVGAARAIFAEMPWLASWLVVSVVLWCGFGGLALRGLRDALMGWGAERRFVVWLLLSLPVVWTFTRVLTQGDSRKRSPVDFALALFAAVAVAGLGRGRARGSTSPAG